MEIPEHIPDLVRDSRLDTEFPDNNTTVHIRKWSRRGMNQKEYWIRGRRIGHGGGGLVFLEESKGSATHLKRAVKEIEAYRAKSHGDDYFRELYVIAKFSQNKYTEHFVKSFGWYEGSGSLFIAMEYCPLGDLRRYLNTIANRRLSEDQAQDITVQLLSGLNLMHDEGFAHRDFKPENILVIKQPPDEWHVKMCDFGLSKRADLTNASSTVKGTPGFLAPEIFASDETLRPPDDWLPVDMWNLGETVFQMLTGHSTFSPRDMLNYKAGKMSFPRMTLDELHINREATNFIQSTMIANPKDRFTASQASGHLWIQEFRDSQTDSVSQEHIEMGTQSSDGHNTMEWKSNVEFTINGAWTKLSSASLSSAGKQEPGSKLGISLPGISSSTFSDLQSTGSSQSLDATPMTSQPLGQHPNEIDNTEVPILLPDNSPVNILKSGPESTEKTVEPTLNSYLAANDSYSSSYIYHETGVRIPTPPDVSGIDSRRGGQDLGEIIDSTRRLGVSARGSDSVARSHLTKMQRDRQRRRRNILDDKS